MPRTVVSSNTPNSWEICTELHGPMVLMGAEFTRAWRLRSWDRLYIPVPFSRIIMRSEVLEPVRPDGEKTTAEDVRAALLRVNPDLPDLGA